MDEVNQVARLINQLRFENSTLKKEIGLAEKQKKNLNISLKKLKIEYDNLIETNSNISKMCRMLDEQETVLEADIKKFTYDNRLLEEKHKTLSKENELEVEKGNVICKEKDSRYAHFKKMLDDRREQLDKFLLTRDDLRKCCEMRRKEVYLEKLQKEVQELENKWAAKGGEYSKEKETEYIIKIAKNMKEVEILRREITEKVFEKSHHYSDKSQFHDKNNNNTNYSNNKNNNDDSNYLESFNDCFNDNIYMGGDSNDTSNTNNNKINYNENITSNNSIIFHDENNNNNDNIDLSKNNNFNIDDDVFGFNDKSKNVNNNAQSNHEINDPNRNNNIKVTNNKENNKESKGKCDSGFDDMFFDLNSFFTTPIKYADDKNGSNTQNNSRNNIIKINNNEKSNKADNNLNNNNVEFDAYMRPMDDNNRMDSIEGFNDTTTYNSGDINSNMRINTTNNNANNQSNISNNNTNGYNNGKASKTSNNFNNSIANASKPLTGTANNVSKKSIDFIDFTDLGIFDMFSSKKTQSNSINKNKKNDNELMNNNSNKNNNISINNKTRNNNKNSLVNYNDTSYSDRINNGSDNHEKISSNRNISFTSNNDNYNISNNDIDKVNTNDTAIQSKNTNDKKNNDDGNINNTNNDDNQNFIENDYIYNKNNQNLIKNNNNLFDKTLAQHSMTKVNCDISTCAPEVDNKNNKLISNKNNNNFLLFERDNIFDDEVNNKVKKNNNNEKIHNDISFDPNKLTNDNLEDTPIEEAHNIINNKNEAPLNKNNANNVQFYQKDKDKDININVKNKTNINNNDDNTNNKDTFKNTIENDVNVTMNNAGNSSEATRNEAPSRTSSFSDSAHKRSLEERHHDSRSSSVDGDVECKKMKLISTPRHPEKAPETFLFKSPTTPVLMTTPTANLFESPCQPGTPSQTHNNFFMVNSPQFIGTEQSDINFTFNDTLDDINIFSSDGNNHNNNDNDFHGVSLGSLAGNFGGSSWGCDGGKLF